MAVEQYRQWIQDLLSARGARGLSQPDVETQAVLDTERDHYLLLHTGWHGTRRTHGAA